MTARERERNARVEGWLGRAGVAAETESFGEKILGGTVLAASERSARSVLAAYNSARQAEGLLAWATPAIYSWDSWVRARWMERNAAGLMLLNPLQEHSIWVRIIRTSEAGKELWHANRLATAAQQAYHLLLQYAPRSLSREGRAGWSGDPSVFSGWMNEFDRICQQLRVASASRLPFDLARDLPGKTSSSPLLLIGFDRLTESQRTLLARWGEWQLDAAGGEQAETEPGSRFFTARNSVDELAACVRWMRQKVTANPESKLLIIAPALERRRGELERALLATRRAVQNIGDEAPEIPLDFEFSLGVPLGRAGVARSAALLLRWLAEPLSEPEVDWLLSSGHCAADEDEEIRLVEAMHTVRDHGLERPEWRFEDLLILGRQHVEGVPDHLKAWGFPPAWGARLVAARERLSSVRPSQSPLEWLQLAGEVLETIGWPGFRPQSSAAFQARERWETMLENCGSLGFDGVEMDWAEFLKAVSLALSMTVFATESTGSPIVISEPFESAGQLADGIWFLSAQEEDWPSRGTANPLLPIALQREAGMPHGSASSDWELARQATERLMASADEVIFSYAEQTGEAATRPSRLILHAVGPPVSIPDRLREAAGTSHDALTECFEDWSQIALKNKRIDGGAAILTSQSNCPFQAFATARLSAGNWEPAENGLNARQRGQLLHSVLHRVWAGAEKGGIKTHFELQAIVGNDSRDLSPIRDFVRPIVEDVLFENSSGGQRNRYIARFPRRYLALEADRLTRLVWNWLAYELTRLPFRVMVAEKGKRVTVGGLELDLRMDRVDELADGSRLIIDYKTGSVGPSAWSGDRPDDVQMPLYATHAFVPEGERLEGLVFGRVRSGNVEFCGRVFDANGLLIANLSGRNGLVKDPLTLEQLRDWRTLIERLGEDFLNGRAEVDPKDVSKTCELCHLHAVCRVSESLPLALELAGVEEDDFETANGDGNEADNG